jgi:hypothetical protein
MIWVRTIYSHIEFLQQLISALREIVHIGLILMPVSGSTYERIGLFMLPGYGQVGDNIFSKHQVKRTIRIK